MNDKHIILFAGYSKIKYVRVLKERFKDRNYQFACAYERPAHKPSKQLYLKQFDHALDLTTQSGKEAFEKIKDDILCITCTQERDMALYIRLLEATERITPEEATRYSAVVDKQAFKEIMRETDPSLVPTSHTVTDTFIESVSDDMFPLVVKPSGLAGSIMVRVVTTKEELIEQATTCQDAIERIATEHYSRPCDIIAESFIEGLQYSVNVYIDNKQHVTFCPIIRVITPLELGINDTYNAIQYTTEDLSPEAYEALTDAVGKIVHRFSLKNTSAHFDCVHTPEGWKFFEVGLRIGGNRQQIFMRSHGFSHIINDILNRIGESVYLPEKIKTASIVQKASVTAGQLVSVSVTRKATDQHEPLIDEQKIAKLQQHVAPLCLGGGTITRHLVSGAEEAAVLNTSRELFNAIQFEVEPH